jgi:peptidoglycan/LPS O-acetylase OafA/YrhL
LPYYQTIFAAWLIFYLLGISAKNYKGTSLKKAILLVAISLLLSIGESYMIVALKLPATFAVSQIKISSFLFSLSLINLFLSAKNYCNIKRSLIVSIGDMSYGIYYVHMFWILVTTKLTNLLNLQVYALPLYQIVQLIITLGLSILSLFIVNKVLKRKLSGLLLGF